MSSDAYTVNNGHNDEDIIKQLLVFGVGTRQEIINAMNHVVNKDDINEITNYMLEKQSMSNDNDDNYDIKEISEVEMKLNKGYYHDEYGNIYSLSIVSKIQSELLQLQPLKKQVKNNENIIGYSNYIKLSQKLLFGNNCNRLINGCIVGFQSLGATAGMNILLNYSYLKYGSIKVYCPSIGWNKHKKLIENNKLLFKEYKYPFKFDKNVKSEKIFIDNNGNIIKFKNGDIILFHGCCHNPTGIDPTIDEWNKIVLLIKKFELIPFFDYTYQGFASGDIEKDSFAIKLFEQQNVKNIFVVQSYTKNMCLLDQKIGCASIVCATKENAENVINDISNNILNKLYDNKYPPNNESAQLVINILNDKNNYIEWKNEVYTMYQRIQKMRNLLQNILIQLIPKMDWKFITQQIGMYIFKEELLNIDQIEILENKYHVHIEENGRIAISSIATNEQMKYLANAIASVL